MQMIHLSWHYQNMTTNTPPPDYDYDYQRHVNHVRKLLQTFFIEERTTKRVLSWLEENSERRILFGKYHSNSPNRSWMTDLTEEGKIIGFSTAASLEKALNRALDAAG